jgi:stress response protein YsnF
MALNNFSNGEQQDTSLVPLQKTTLAPKTLIEEVIPLLEERLMVNLTRRKTGEVVVRKEIETHILQMQVPIRREKLIVEQVSPEYKL